MTTTGYIIICVEACGKKCKNYHLDLASLINTHPVFENLLHHLQTVIGPNSSFSCQGHVLRKRSGNTRLVCLQFQNNYLIILWRPPYHRCESAVIPSVPWSMDYSEGSPSAPALAGALGEQCGWPVQYHKQLFPLNFQLYFQQSTVGWLSFEDTKFEGFVYFTEPHRCLSLKL